MKKYCLPVAILMIVVLLGSLACAAAAPSELKPCTVDLGYVSNEWGGEEVIAANVFLTVKNPNPVPVTLDSVDYRITVNKTEVGMKTLVPRLTIPAMGSVGLSNISIIDYSASLAVQQNILSGSSGMAGRRHNRERPGWHFSGQGVSRHHNYIRSNRSSPHQRGTRRPG